VEILQNCRVFNDGVFDPIAARQTSDDQRIVLRHGEPIRFGIGGCKGIAEKNLAPQIVDLESGQASEGELLIHDTQATSPALAALLAALEPPDFPMALGIFRDVERPTYESLMLTQIASSAAARGQGDVTELLNGDASWEIG
jgi:2-oxoglutarate ferredoxin oxidoreductase subunit beta